ncbi:MAG TPA: hypothetical protein VG265_04100 [Gaiellaceae bacterium]|nr:hypothetical protein [Gaiellaceae bacterium]
MEELGNVATGRSDHRPDESPVAQDVIDLVRAGKTREAIAHYRELTGVDFGHAQAVVAGALTPAPYRFLLFSPD